MARMREGEVWVDVGMDAAAFVAGVGVVVGVVGADGVGMHIDAAFAKGAVKAAVDVLPGAQTAQESKAMVGSGNAGEGQSAILEASRAGAPGEEVLVSNGHTDGATSKVLLVPPEQFSRRLAH
eukprot:CAMPEP_0202414460 /NCGR_PEP_ID=MMETSP1128-20130828/32905_1 /ASSEMBLY_ACC=CAM_ASM_000463 /TAXON_ID=3047 /ORGANISM="Dunaliella tertiolecta, Strain CCMP1320" /LENGTH=122 /DNA_ID=CAMNT_0049020887 /DNA_START=223 /DNA_END=588 /DNA_ORIENTATION=-